MERPSQTPEQVRALRHFEARIRIARLANAMSATFKQGHDVDQSDEYRMHQALYLLAQCEEAEIDKSDDPLPVTNLRG